MSLFTIPSFVVGGGRPELPSANTCPALFVRLMVKCWHQSADERPAAGEALRRLGSVRAELLNQSHASLQLFTCVNNGDLARLTVIINESEERHLELRRASIDIKSSGASCKHSFLFCLFVCLSMILIVCVSINLLAISASDLSQSGNTAHLE
jgi:hypothetical protein